LKGSVRKTTSRWSVLGVVAALALSVAVVTATAGASSWHAASTGDAVAAKKKCKKKGKKSAAAAKKKGKCKKKKKKATPPVPAVPPPPKPPIVRAEVSWSTDADIDVHAWAGGLHVGWNEFFGVNEVEIPGFTYEPSGSGRERIIDTANPSTRGLTFGVCYYPDFEAGSAGPTDINVHVVYANGAVEDFVFEDFVESESSTDPTEEGGAPDPVEDWCPLEI
jgi:hypothetical protein